LIADSNRGGQLASIQNAKAIFYNFNELEHRTLDQESGFSNYFPLNIAHQMPNKRTFD
jgi:hypothetical protein